MADDTQRPSNRVARERGTPVMVRLQAEMMEKLERRSGQRGLPPSTFARQLIKEGLDRLDQQEPS